MTADRFDGPSQCPDTAHLGVHHGIALLVSLAWLAVVLASTGRIEGGISYRGPWALGWLADVDHYDRLPALVTYYVANAWAIALSTLVPTGLLWWAVLRRRPLRKPTAARVAAVSVTILALGGVAIAAGAGFYLSTRMAVWDARYADHRMSLARKGTTTETDGRLQGLPARYAERYGNFLNVPPTPDADIVFVGDSITESIPWPEYFPSLMVLNRGIGNDKIAGVLERAAEINRHAPKVISLMIGLNDILPTAPADETARLFDRYRTLVDALKADTLILHPILPIHIVDERDRPVLNKSLAKIREFNSRQSEHCDGRRVICAGPPPGMIDDRGELAREMTVDGAHLSGRGAKAWVAHIRSLAPVQALTERRPAPTGTGDR